MDAEQTLNNARIEERHWWFAARRRIVRGLLHQLVPPSPDALVIDVGCGTGGNGGSLAEEYRCVGIDASKEAIECATRRYPKARFILGEVPRDLGALVSEAKVFLLMDVLEHVPDDFLFFSTLAAEARPGAYFLVTVPAHEALWSAHDLASRHYRRYERARLTRVFEGLPVTCRLLTPYNARLLPLVRAARAVNNRLGRTSGDAGTDMRVPTAPLNAALRGIFGGEAGPLARALESGGRQAFADGVSLLAVLRREPGAIVPRQRPADVRPDAHAPGR